MKLHIGVDGQSGLAQSAVVTAANVHDKNPLPQLLHGAEQRVYGDSAYSSQKELSAGFNALVALAVDEILPLARKRPWVMRRQAFTPRLFFVGLGTIFLAAPLGRRKRRLTVLTRRPTSDDRPAAPCR